MIIKNLTQFIKEYNLNNTHWKVPGSSNPWVLQKTDLGYILTDLYSTNNHLLPQLFADSDEVLWTESSKILEFRNARSTYTFQLLNR